MDKITFDLHYIQHLEEGLFFLVLSMSLTFFILRKHIFSIFDPMFFAMLMASCAYSVVFYLYYFSFISEYYFYSFLTTQIAFFIGFTLNKPPNSRNFQKISINDINFGSTAFLYPISFIVFFLSQLIVYKVSGIPLLMESRLETFTGGSGYGVFNRIIFVSSNISLSIAVFSLFFLENKGFKKIFHFSVILFSVVVALLSGSKGGLLLIMYNMALTAYFSKKLIEYNQKYIQVEKTLYKLLIILFPFALFTLYLQSELDNFFALIISIAMRFLHTGDIFFMLYPNNYIDYIKDANGFIALFKDLLGTFRIINWQDLPVNIGFQVFALHNNEDILSGPNARHNVFGLVYFGFFGAIFFSFILGLLVGFIRNNLYKRLNMNLQNLAFFVILAFSANFLNQDPAGMAVGFFISILIFYPILYIPSNILYYISKRGFYVKKNTFNTRSI